MSEITARIRAAFENSPVKHLEGLFKTRNPGPGAVGSVFLEEQSLETLLAAAWQPLEHPNIMPGCSAFTAHIRGRLGVVALAELDPEVRVRLEDGHSTDMVEAVVRGVAGHGPTTNLTTLIMGPHSGKEVVFTFHPGLPIRPSTLPAAGNEGQEMSAKEALSLGLTHAKVA